MLQTAFSELINFAEIKGTEESDNWVKLINATESLWGHSSWGVYQSPCQVYKFCLFTGRFLSWPWKTQVKKVLLDGEHEAQLSLNFFSHKKAERHTESSRGQYLQLLTWHRTDPLEELAAGSCSGSVYTSPCTLRSEEPCWLAQRGLLWGQCFGSTWVSWAASQQVTSRTSTWGRVPAHLVSPTARAGFQPPGVLTETAGLHPLHGFPSQPQGIWAH